ncbi:hypothetical protein GCM10018785_23030 [Streptomyces longispororuber]|uniref:Uncharacterized protein n=1 Tax=Streptomyces longispororuber TaxID=68230 RepID=A0A918ZJB2_9ACTN|nr:hypothetical protein GCM10018785_23030 [Streptomyces longispororuber]
MVSSPPICLDFVCGRPRRGFRGPRSPWGLAVFRGNPRGYWGPFFIRIYKTHGVASQLLHGFGD